MEGIMAASKGEYFLSYLRAPFDAASPALKVIDKFDPNNTKMYGREWYHIELMDEVADNTEGEMKRFGSMSGTCPFLVYAGFNNSDVADREEAIGKAEKILRNLGYGATTINGEVFEIDTVEDIKTFRAYSDKDVYGMAMITGSIKYKTITI